MAWSRNLLCLLLIATAGCAGPDEAPDPVERPYPVEAPGSIDWSLNVTGPLGVSFVVAAPNGTASCRIVVDFVDDSSPTDMYSLLVSHDQHANPSSIWWASKWYDAHVHVAGVDSRELTETVNDNGRLQFDATYPGMPDGARFTIGIQATAGPRTIVKAGCEDGAVQGVKTGREVLIFNADSAHNGASATASPAPGGFAVGSVAAASALESVGMTVSEQEGHLLLVGQDIMAAHGTIRTPAGSTPFQHLPDPVEGTRLRFVADDHAGRFAVEWTQAAIWGDDLVGAIIGLSSGDRALQGDAAPSCQHLC